MEASRREEKTQNFQCSKTHVEVLGVENTEFTEELCDFWTHLLCLFWSRQGGINTYLGPGGNVHGSLRGHFVWL